METYQMRACFGEIMVFLLLILTTRANYLNLVDQFLAPQNAARAAIGMRPLDWDPRLASYAQWYANQRREDCALKHSNGPYGENIFWGSGDGWTPAEAAAAWVSERKWYSYWSNSCAEGEECGHYTQIVWGGTKRVGCARVVCDEGMGVFMTCNYDPPGNYIGDRPY
ncbi:pathogenesis-related protein PR-1-like [Durio zibethinus]|uniref:Pathogenesis-related protein 1 n=1 Tax=Durio zibethinus TaxID=66656 RepID=A0A6P5ZVT8_DURZI|nr:pathogenesis-related protein PR-1-like [Durio zibethinus]